MNAPRFPVGTQFIPIGRKEKIVHTVIDYHVTTNLAGEVVCAKYVSEHEFCGQKVRVYDVADATIARGLVGDIADFNK